MTDDWVKPILPWTYSDLDAYNTCPKQFYELKFRPTLYKEQFNDSQLWGIEVHNALDAHIKHRMPLPERMKMYAPMMNSILATPGDKYSELRLAVNHELQDCDWKDPEAWNRGKEDLVIVNGTKALSIDWKLGKRKPNSRQLEVSACRVLAHFPQVQTVTTAFAWLATKQWDKAVYGRPQLSVLWEGFYEGVGQMLWSYENNTWPAKPSGLCKKSKKPGSTYMGCSVASCPHSEYYRKPT